MNKIQPKWDFMKMKRKYRGIKINIYRHMDRKDLPYKPGEKVAFINDWGVHTGYASFFNPCFDTSATISEGHSFLCISDKPQNRLPRELELGGPKILDRPQLEDVAYPTPEGFAYLWNRLAEQVIDCGSQQVLRAQQELAEAITNNEQCGKLAKKFFAKANEYEPQIKRNLRSRV